MDITPSTSKQYLWKLRIVGSVSGTRVEQRRLPYAADEIEKARCFVETAIEGLENRPAEQRAKHSFHPNSFDRRRLLEITFLKELAG